MDNVVYSGPLHNIAEAVDFGFALTAKLKEAKSDGKLNWLDVPKFFSLSDDADAAITDADQIPNEWQNASPNERQELVNHFAAKFDLANDVAERRIEKAIGLAVAAYALATDDDQIDETANASDETV